jgi:hypothetical protein
MERFWETSTIEATNARIVLYFDRFGASFTSSMLDMCLEVYDARMATPIDSSTLQQAFNSFNINTITPKSHFDTSSSTPASSTAEYSPALSNTQIVISNTASPSTMTTVNSPIRPELKVSLHNV